MNKQWSPANAPWKTSSGPEVAGNDIDPPSAVAIYVAAILLMVCAYTAVFAVTLSVGIAEAIGSALSNVIPLAALSASAYLGLRRWALHRNVLLQASVHVVLAPTFAVTWYCSTLLALALTRLVAEGQFMIGSFSGIALVWQLFQGVVLYALVAAMTYALRGGRLAATVQLIEQGVPLERYLTRTGDELVPVAIDDVVSIRGAQDYAEVTTVDGRSHLVRLSLGEFEARLPSQRFVRVHRSTIINLAHLGRAEPIGSGRMALHLTGGQSVETSRSGTQVLRSRVL